MNLVEKLDDFLKKTKDGREVKRILAAKLAIQGKCHKEIENLLKVSSSFISKWKNAAIFQGVERLKMQYKGGKSYLSKIEKQKVIEWLRGLDYCRLGDLQGYLEKEYKIVFSSNQSYYALFKEAKISWKKSQKKNPSKDEELVKEKKKEIKKKLEEWKKEINAERLTVFMIDECHLLWGDVEGYLWGRTDKRIEIPIVNQKEKKSYYGALDYRSKEFIIKGYDSANTKNTIDFLRYLQQRREGQKLAVIWDGASYHGSYEFQGYLSQVNQDLGTEDWQITCLKFAPNAPEQDPVEDIWLQTKNFVRKFRHICHSFKWVKWLFEFFADGQVFEFPKIHEYGLFTQPV
jgi:putative transposase